MSETATVAVEFNPHELGIRCPKWDHGLDSRATAICYKGDNHAATNA